MQRHESPQPWYEAVGFTLILAVPITEDVDEFGFFNGDAR